MKEGARSPIAPWSQTKSSMMLRLHFAPGVIDIRLYCRGLEAHVLEVVNMQFVMAWFFFNCESCVEHPSRPLSLRLKPHSAVPIWLFIRMNYIISWLRISHKSFVSSTLLIARRKCRPTWFRILFKDLTHDKAAWVELRQARELNTSFL